MELIKIVWTSLGSITVLFILTKLIGNREMAELSMFDYINSITIGSIAAEMATALEDDFREPLIAMIVYAIVIIVLSFLTSKSIKCRRFICGKTLILLDKGKIYNNNFKKAKIALNEFLVQCRTNGYFNLSDIETALLEPNGKISFIPNVLTRPVIPEDFSLNPKQLRPSYNVIIDGKILENNLKATGNNNIWLEKELEKQKIKNIQNIFLATCDENNNLSVYTKTDLANSHDRFI